MKIAPILRKDRVRKDGTATIYIRVTKNRESRFIVTGVIIPLDRWSNENQKISLNLHKVGNINNAHLSLKLLSKSLWPYFYTY
ncbi:MAG: hypothetical protein IKU96_03940 [Alistipes sp.]|nr:hypothetical protein [Alistipes sp.]